MIAKGKDISSIKLWLKQVKLWPQQFSIVIICILAMIPLSLLLTIFLSYTIQSINSIPVELSWQKFLGHQISVWIFPLIENTSFERGISVHIQKEYFAIFLVAISCLYSYLNYYSDYKLRDLGEKLAQKLRSDLTKKYLSLTHASSTQVDAGLLSSMVGEDMRETQQTFTRLISSLLKDGLSSIVLLIWLIFLDPHLFLLFLMVLIPAAIILRFTGKTLKKLSRQGLQFESELLSGMLERMRGWQTIQVHKAINFEILNFNQINTKIFHVWRRSTRAKSLGTPLVECLGVIASALIIIVALRRITQGELDSIILTSFMVTIGLLSDKINRMSNQLNSTRKGTDALHRVRNFLLEPYEERCITTSSRQQKDINSIDFVNTSIGYDSKHVLVDNLNLSAKKGDLIVIIGPSGIGKSTFIKTLLGLQKELSGEMLINKRKTDEQEYIEYSAHISFTPQEPFLFTGSVFDNIVYPENLNSEDIHIMNRIEQALKLSQLDINPSINVRSLSGGEKQRLMFARIFFRRPHLIVIDEGTSALDLANELKIIENLKEHTKDSITFVIAHRPAIKTFATKVLDFSTHKVIKI